MLVDGEGKRENQIKGKTDTYRTSIMDIKETPKKLSSKSDFANLHNLSTRESVGKGDYIIGKVREVSNNTLFMDPVCKVDFKTFFELSDSKPFFT